MRVGIYARVSAHDQQTLPMQLEKMREYIENRKWKLKVEVEEVGSGAKPRPNREGLLKMARHDQRIRPQSYQGGTAKGRTRRAGNRNPTR